MFQRYYGMKNVKLTDELGFADWEIVKQFGK
jgi:hypothetical protein